MQLYAARKVAASMLGSAVQPQVSRQLRSALGRAGCIGKSGLQYEVTDVLIYSLVHPIIQWILLLGRTNGRGYHEKAQTMEVSERAFVNWFVGFTALLQFMLRLGLFFISAALELRHSQRKWR